MTPAAAAAAAVGDGAPAAAAARSPLGSHVEAGEGEAGRRAVESANEEDLPPRPFAEDVSSLGGVEDGDLTNWGGLETSR